MLLKDSRYSQRLTIGKQEILETPHDALRRFYPDWYRPDLAAIIAVGDFDPAAVSDASASASRGSRPPRLRGPPRSRGAAARRDPVLHRRDPEAPTRGSRLLQAPGQAAGRLRRLPAPAGGDDLRRADELPPGRLGQQADPPFLYAAAASDNLVRTGGAYFQAAGVVPGGVERGLAAPL